MAEWWNKKAQIPLDNSDFHKILNFFLFYCPVEIEKGKKKNGSLRYEKVSKQATTLRQQGWIKGHLKTLLSCMKNTTSGHLEYHKCESTADIATKCSEIENGCTLNDKEFELIVIAERSDMNLTSAIFYYIRNALAHGSFSVVRSEKNVTYYLESAKGDETKARMRLREQTLLKWIEDFKLSPNTLKAALAEERREREKQKRKGRAA